MKVVAGIIEQLRSGGHRMTSARKGILDLLSSSARPVSALALQRALGRRGLLVAKTTVYRELAFLKAQGLVLELQFGDAQKYYELTPATHHHHAICTSCDRVEDIELQNDLSRIEREIERRRKFAVSRHSLEFFGLCKNCQHA